MTKIRKYAVQMSYEVSSEDKDRANKAVMRFDYLLKTMKDCNSHLDLIYTPFKDNQNISPEQLYKVRAALRRYRDKVVDNFNRLKRVAFKCFVSLQPFATDTQIIKLTKSFTMSIADIEKQVNRFVELFSNFKSKDFVPGLIKAVENVKKEIAQLDQIIEDRIKDHLSKHILHKTWIDTLSEELQEKIEEKLPFTVELVNERNEKLKGNT